MLHSLAAEFFDLIWQHRRRVVPIMMVRSSQLGSCPLGFAGSAGSAEGADSIKRNTDPLSRLSRWDVLLTLWRGQARDAGRQTLHRADRTVSCVTSKWGRQARERRVRTHRPGGLDGGRCLLIALFALVVAWRRRNPAAIATRLSRCSRDHASRHAAVMGTIPVAGWSSTILHYDFDMIRDSAPPACRVAALVDGVGWNERSTSRRTRTGALRCDAQRGEGRTQGPLGNPVGAYGLLGHSLVATSLDADLVLPHSK